MLHNKLIPNCKNIKFLHKKLIPLGLLSASIFLVACGAEIEEDIQARVVPVNTQLVSTGNMSTQISFAGQVNPQEQIHVTGRLPGGMVDQVFANVGDFVNAGDILFTMDLTDLDNQVAALTAQLATAEAAVRAAQTGVGMATGGGGVQQQQIQASSGVSQAEVGVSQAEVGVAQAEAGVAQAEAGVANAQIAIDQTQGNINQARLGLTQAENAYSTAIQNLTDSTVLFNAGAMSRVQLDQAEMSVENARIGLEQATNNYNIANTSIEQANIGLLTSQTSLTQAQNSLEQAQNGLIQAQQALADAQASYRVITQTMPNDNRTQAQDGLAQAVAQRNALQVQLNAAIGTLDDATVRSPISGIINSRNIEPQTMIGGGVPPFTVVSENAVMVSVEVTQSIVNLIQINDYVDVFIPAATNEAIIGQVASVSPAANGTRTFTVEINIDNEDGILRPGMFTEVFFTIQEIDNAIIVPRQAVLTQNNETVVYLANGSTAIRHYVTTGLDNGIEIEITSGISQGDEIIITGQNFVTHGVYINVIERQSEGA